MRPTVNNEARAGAGGHILELTAEHVADVVAGSPAIGAARAALQQAGWRATIAGNRITVNDDVVVHFIGALGGAAIVVDARRLTGADSSPISI